MALCISAALLAAAPEPGKAEPWGTPYDRFFEQPGAEVTTTTGEDDAEVRRVTTPGKILIIQSRKDGKTETSLSDVSGHGAVWCLWFIYVDVKIAIDNCDNLNNPLASERLGKMIDAINEFIVENSLRPVSIGWLEGAIKNRENNFHERNNTANGGESQCQVQSGQDLAQLMADGIGAASDEEFQSYIDEALSEPRLPVSNPCL